MKSDIEQNTWYRLDHAGKLFPAVSGKTNPSTFRVSLMLKKEINPEFLQEAVNVVLNRFSTLDVKLNRGIFWHFLARNENQLFIEPETLFPCAPIDITDNKQGFLLRVLYHGCKISVELFHSLTDGVGALEFLKSLTYQYLTLLGETIDNVNNFIIDPNSIPSSTEKQDSFEAYYSSSDIQTEVSLEALHIKGTVFEPYGHNVIHGIMSASQLNMAAKKHSTTITAYLTAILIKAIHNATAPLNVDKKQIMISVPVNLRGVFDSRSLRNFFSVINVGMYVIDDITLGEMIVDVTNQLKEKTTKEYLKKAIANNMKFEKNIASRFTPVKIKDFAIKLGFDRFGELGKTMTLTNLGCLQIPESMSSHIDAAEATIYPTTKSPINCAVLSVNDKITITFTRSIIENDIIKEFFNILVDDSSLDVEIISNDWGMEESDGERSY